MPRSFVSFSTVLPVAFSLICGVSQIAWRAANNVAWTFGPVTFGVWTHRPFTSTANAPASEKVIGSRLPGGQFVRSAFDLCSFLLPLTTIPV